MSKKIFITILILAVLVLKGFSAENKSNIFNLSKLPDTSSTHPWVLAFEDKVMVVWREEGGYSGKENNIYYTVITGKSLSTPKAAYNDPKIISKNPHMDIGPDGMIHLVWADGAGSNREVYYGRYKDGEWIGEKKKVFTSPYNSNWMRVGILPDNTVNAVWASAMIEGISKHWIVRNTWKAGDNWHPTGKILSKNLKWSGDWDLAMYPDIFCKENRVYVVWREGSHKSAGIKFSMKEGDSEWSYPVDITPRGKICSWPGIVVDSKNNIHVICSATGGKVYYTGCINGSWTKLQPINTKRHTRGFVCLDIDKHDRLHAVYRCENDLYYNVGNNQGVWGKEKRISFEKEAHYPCVSAGPDGFVHIVWCTADEGENSDVMYRRIRAPEAPEVPEIPEDPEEPEEEENPEETEDPEEEEPTKPRPIYTSVVDFLMDVMGKPGVGYILKFTNNERMEQIPYFRFQAFEISKYVDIAVFISTHNDAGPVCGFYYRGIRFDVGLSVKLHRVAKGFRGTKVSLIMGVNLPIKKRK